MIGTGGVNSRLLGIGLVWAAVYGCRGPGSQPLLYSGEGAGIAYRVLPSLKQYRFAVATSPRSGVLLVEFCTKSTQSELEPAVREELGSSITEDEVNNLGEREFWVRPPTTAYRRIMVAVSDKQNQACVGGERSEVVLELFK